MSLLNMRRELKIPFDTVYIGDRTYENVESVNLDRRFIFIQPFISLDPPLYEYHISYKENGDIKNIYGNCQSFDFNEHDTWLRIIE